MLFKRNMEPSCSYCTHGNKIGDTEVMCLKRGIVSPAGACRKFKYDPLKREPPKHISLKLDDLSPADFSLE